MMRTDLAADLGSEPFPAGRELITRTRPRVILNVRNRFRHQEGFTAMAAEGPTWEFGGACWCRASGAGLAAHRRGSRRSRLLQPQRRSGACDHRRRSRRARTRPSQGRALRSRPVSQWRSSKTRLRSRPPLRSRPQRLRGGHVHTWPATAEKQSSSGPECGSGRGVPARKRRPEGGGGRIECRTRPVDDVLDQCGDQLLARRRRRRRRGSAIRFGSRTNSTTRSRTAEPDYDIDRSELRVTAVRACVENGEAWRFPHLGDAVVDRGQGGVRPDEVGKQSENDSGADDEHRGSVRLESRLGLGIEPRMRAG